MDVFEVLESRADAGWLGGLLQVRRAHAMQGELRGWSCISSPPVPCCHASHGLGRRAMMRIRAVQFQLSQRESPAAATLSQTELLASSHTSGNETHVIQDPGSEHNSPSCRIALPAAPDAQPFGEDRRSSAADRDNRGPAQPRRREQQYPPMPIHTKRGHRPPPSPACSRVVPSRPQSPDPPPLPKAKFGAR